MPAMTTVSAMSAATKAGAIMAQQNVGLVLGDGTVGNGRFNGSSAGVGYGRYHRFHIHTLLVSQIRQARAFIMGGS